MKKTYKIFIACLSFSATFAQTPKLLSDQEMHTIPTWNEHLHFTINKSKDTSYIAVGNQADKFLYQEDHYTADGMWQGVDRYVWQGDNLLRIYFYDGSEAMVSIAENRILEYHQVFLDGSNSFTSYQWEQERLKRISTQIGDTLQERVFVYRPSDQKLQKIKSYQNGLELQTLKFSYNSIGLLQKEELWSKDEILCIATYTYRDSLLQSAVVMDLKREGQQLKETHYYTYLNNGLYQRETRHYSAQTKEYEKLSLCTFDSNGSLLRKEINYVDHQQLEKEVFLYRYPQKEGTDFEVLSLQASGR